MKVPKGKRVMVGNKEYPAGAELPDAVAQKVGLKTADTLKKKETTKRNESEGTNRDGSGGHA